MRDSRASERQIVSWPGDQRELVPPPSLLKQGTGRGNKGEILGGSIIGKYPETTLNINPEDIETISDQRLSPNGFMFYNKHLMYFFLVKKWIIPEIF